MSEREIDTVLRVRASLAAPGEVVPSCLDRRVHQAVARTVAETAGTIGLAGTAKL